MHKFLATFEFLPKKKAPAENQAGALNYIREQHQIRSAQYDILPARLSCGPGVSIMCFAAQKR